MLAQEEHAQCSWLWVGWLIASVLPVVMKWTELSLMCLLWFKKRKKETKPFVNSNVSHISKGRPGEIFLGWHGNQIGW